MLKLERISYIYMFLEPQGQGVHLETQRTSVYPSVTVPLWL